MKTGGAVTRKRLLATSMKLFAQMPYDKVTFKEIEAATGLSRGALMYHVPNKEALFRDAVDPFAFRVGSLTSLHSKDKTSLEQTIKKFVKLLVEEQRAWRKEGLKNINLAVLNIQLSYFSVNKDSLRVAGEWYENECSIWREVIQAAIKSGEIRKIDATLYARMFEDLYLGSIYAGVSRTSGYSAEKVGDLLMGLYNLIKK